MKPVLALCLAAVLLFGLAHADHDDDDDHDNDSCVRNYPYRSFDGSCNNREDPSLGAAGGVYRRGCEGAEYNPDGSPVTANRPIERVLSNKISRDDPALKDAIPHSLMATQFGQFVNHDLNNNGFQDPGSLDYPDPLVVPEKDDSFCWVFTNPANPASLVNMCLPPYNQDPLFTTKFSDTVVIDGVKQVRSHASAWLDLSPIYGVNDQVASLLRTHTGGRLLTTDYVGMTTSPLFTFGFFQFGFGNTAPFSCIDCPPSFTATNGQVPVPPLMNPTLPNPFGYNGNRIFVSGDERVGENGALSMFHTLFIRNHNRHAAALAAANPSWDDEKLFQRARRRNIAEYQNIVLYQYLPSEFGSFFEQRVGNYHGYDEDVDAAVNIAFASAAFRYAHSSFRNYAPINQCGVDTLFNQPAQGLKLMFGGQTGGPILPIDVYGEIGSWENLIRGLIGTNTAPNDIMIDAALRDLPFTFPIAGGTDVWVLDIHRARENGVPNYVVLQEQYGRDKDKFGYGSPGCPAALRRKTDPDPIACFNNLVPYNATLAANLASLYPKIKHIDPLVGLMVEPHVPGTSFGYTLGNIIMDTYSRARDGDRFWFENRNQPAPFSDSELDEIYEVFIDDLLKANFNLPPAQVPANPFLVPANYRSNLGSGC